MTYNLLQFTVFLLPISVHVSRHDTLYHTVCLALTCSSIVRHWCTHLTWSIQVADKILAHLCYLLCAYTHLVEHRNFTGVLCLVLVLALWVYEHNIKNWTIPHALIHIISVVGITAAVVVRDI